MFLTAEDSLTCICETSIIMGCATFSYLLLFPPIFLCRYRGGGDTEEADVCGGEDPLCGNSRWSHSSQTHSSHPLQCHTLHGPACQEHSWSHWLSHLCHSTSPISPSLSTSTRNCHQFRDRHCSKAMNMNEIVLYIHVVSIGSSCVFVCPPTIPSVLRRRIFPSDCGRGLVTRALQGEEGAWLTWVEVPWLPRQWRDRGLLVTQSQTCAVSVSAVYCETTVGQITTSGILYSGQRVPLKRGRRGRGMW